MLIYNKTTGKIEWSEDLTPKRAAELEAIGYGISDLIVTENWAKAYINLETNELYNAATPEEQDAHENQYKDEV